MSQVNYYPPKRGGARRVSFLHPVTEDTAEWRPGATRGSRAIRARLQRRKVVAVDPAAFVFGPGDRPRTAHELQTQWRRTLLAAGLRYRTPEQLRHTWASIMLSRNAPLLYVAEAGGWASANVLLKVYARWMPSQTAVVFGVDQGADSATQAQSLRGRVNDSR